MNPGDIKKILYTADDLAAIVDQLTVESVVTCIGPVVENEYVKMGGREMLPEEMEILSVAEPLPLTKDAAIDSRMDYRWVDLRSDKNTLIFKAQTELVAALREFYQLGLRVPKDVAIIGMSNIEMSQYANPPLTTIDVPTGEIGIAAARALAGRIRGDNTLPKRILLPSTLIERDTV